VHEGDVVIPGRLSNVHSVRDLLREIQARPALWLNDKTLTGLKDLLFGYEIACHVHGVAVSAPFDDPTLHSFAEWLQARYHKVGNWYQLVIDQSPSESVAFDCFFNLLDEYERDK
jgi:hypothetical protein